MPIIEIAQVHIEILRLRITQDLPHRRVRSKAKATTLRSITVIPVVRIDGVSYVELSILLSAEKVCGLCFEADRGIVEQT